jgi:transketolase
MRKIFATQVEEIMKTNKQVVFITNDVGYNALEPIQASFPDRFINAGVAEQNMIGVAAGLAKKGFIVFCYGIAPFVTFRCLEQIKIDICLHNLPVFIIGNGGGYGYGIMGPTHHAIEDLACLSALPNMNCFIPAFNNDIAYCLQQMITNKQPSYLRLGLSIDRQSYQTKDISQILTSNQPKLTILVLGPLITNTLEAIDSLQNIDLFTAIKMPIKKLDPELIASLGKSKKLIIIEEHVSRGGLAENISLLLLENEIRLNSFKALYALGYPKKEYGDQGYYQKQSGLDSQNIRHWIDNLL